MSRRVDYDSVAPVYDRGLYREKAFDPELRGFLSERASLRPIRILDVGCGTGAQLAANRRERQDLACVGVDRSLGMLRIARARDRKILWLHADAAAMPFLDGSFDYVSNQFAFHHIDRKCDFLAEAARVLRSGGQFTIRNLDPWSMQNWVLYRYFPAALERDLCDFMPIPEIIELLLSAGLVDVTVDRRQRMDPVALADFESDVRSRQGRSQLIALPDADYETGLAQVEAELAQLGPTELLASEKCDITIKADKP